MNRRTLLREERFLSHRELAQRLYGKTRRDVSKKLTKAIADRDGRITFNAGTLTVREHLDRWMKDSLRGTVRPSTVERHEINVRVHINSALGQVKLKSLTPAHVRALPPREVRRGPIACYGAKDPLHTP